ALLSNTDDSSSVGDSSAARSRRIDNGDNKGGSYRDGNSNEDSNNSDATFPNGHTRRRRVIKPEWLTRPQLPGRRWLHACASPVLPPRLIWAKFTSRVMAKFGPRFLGGIPCRGCFQPAHRSAAEPEPAVPRDPA